MKEIFNWFFQLVSGMLPFVLLCFAGVYFTLKTNAVQFRKFFEAFKTVFGAEKGGDKVSSFGAVCNSLSATIGTGNIAGVAFAISVGGAGAVFWMWISGLLSMAVKAVEIVVAILYRKKSGEDFYGGPMHYISECLNGRFAVFGIVFSFAGLGASFFTGNITQVNACVSVFEESFALKLFVGFLLFGIVAFVITGGLEKITHFTAAVLPFMSVLYIILCLGVILANFNLVDDAFTSIFKGAFSPRAVTGGAVGSLGMTVVTGAQKGIFSNEAGMGTAGMAHAAARDASPQNQGLFGVFEVFVDTLLICTLTALTILCSSVIIDYGKTASSELVDAAMGTFYGGFSTVCLGLMLCLFAVSSIIGWAFYGISCAEFLLGKLGKKLFCFTYPVFCLVGAVTNTSFAWSVAELFNGIMLIINILAVLTLSGKAVSILKGETNEKQNYKCAESLKR